MCSFRRQDYSETVIFCNFVGSNVKIVDQKRPANKPANRVVLVIANLLLMALISVALGWLALSLLDVWSGHGKN